MKNHRVLVLVVFVIFVFEFPFILIWFLAKVSGTTMVEYAQKHVRNRGGNSVGGCGGCGGGD
jgi:uncharacterized integral membrane protein